MLFYTHSTFHIKILKNSSLKMLKQFIADVETIYTGVSLHMG